MRSQFKQISLYENNSYFKKTDDYNGQSDKIKKQNTKQHHAIITDELVDDITDSWYDDTN